MDIFSNTLFYVFRYTIMEMGKRGRGRVEKYFTWTRIAKQTAEIYAQTIEIS
ncbi:MAG: hypothetical protein MUO26_04980 [Methanotrichaceae archaeon]|nr:hypothetical protein [Methanotrichaceae archaeon]